MSIHRMDSNRSHRSVASNIKNYEKLIGPFTDQQQA